MEEEALGRGAIAGILFSALVAAAVALLLMVNGYTLTRQPPEPVLVPIDCKVVA